MISLCALFATREWLRSQRTERIPIMNVLREKLVFVATKNSMFDLIKLKRELKAGKVMLGYSSNDLT
jgi:hypothetical protein